MKLYFLYTISILLVLWPYQIVISDISKNLSNRTEQIDSVITSYSHYLQNR